MDGGYSTGEVAKILGCSYYTIYKWIRRGWIKVVQLPNRRYRISEEEVERLKRLFGGRC